MSNRYTIHHDQLAQPGFTTTVWLDGMAFLYGPDGIAVLERRPDHQLGEITFAMRGQWHNLVITPCPTRAGLVRMACREIRRIVKEKT